MEAAAPKEAATPKMGFARLLQLAARKKALVIASALLATLAAIFSFVPYFAIYFAISTVVTTFPNFDADTAASIAQWGWLAVGGAIGNLLCYFGALVCSHLAAFETLYELKIDFARHLARVPLGFHVLIGSGKLRKIMDENIEKIEGFIAHQLPDLVAALASPIVAIIMLLVIDWRFGLAALVAVILALLLQMLAYGGSGVREMMRTYQSSLAEMNNATVEYIRGISVVKAFKQTAYSFRRLHSTIQNYTKMVIPYTLGFENWMCLFATLTTNIYLFLLPVAFLLVLIEPNHAHLATVFMFYLVFVPSLGTILTKVLYVTSSGLQIQGGVEAMDKVLAVPEMSQPTQGTARIATTYDIAFTDVQFSYQNTDAAEETIENPGEHAAEEKTEAVAPGAAGEKTESDPHVELAEKTEAPFALNGVTFVARQGQTTALVGPSGGGKSTIAHLVCRFFDVDAGHVTIGGVDVRQMTTEYLMSLVGFVFQDVFLFKQSVADNIRMGNPDASDDEVRAAAHAAQCHEFIMRLPEGYQTVIGAKGVHLSGGERQRIAIARAIVKNAPIVVLDEATAFADPENEHLIQKSFETLLRDKTVVIIAHRLTTVQHADNIVVVEDGHVQEQGRHDELLAQQGRYARMWRTYHESLSWTITAASSTVADVTNTRV
ncbi:MAG: ABC transporter ATP-binding protein/permease [Coriobacteriales bacterium]|jgi:ATP-binding cassette subfamily B protein|nr:ABC transporter ATP-binding protein/permease [Coriobacteriales bacterium]